MSGCSSAGTWRLCSSLGRIRSPSLAPVLERAGGCRWNKPSQTHSKPHGTGLRAGGAAQELSRPSSAMPGSWGPVGRLTGKGGWLENSSSALPSLLPGAPCTPRVPVGSPFWWIPRCAYCPWLGSVAACPGPTCQRRLAHRQVQPGISLVDVSISGPGSH